MEAESDQNSWFAQILKYAEKGDVAGFNSRLKDEPDVLEDMAAATRNTVLHVAAKNGHVDFVKEILKIKPRLAKELDHNGYSPLHLACARGHVGIASAIISSYPNLYLLRDGHSRIPLHCAVSHAKVDVILKFRELIANSDSDQLKNDGLEEVTERGETALHLALTSNQEAAFLALMDWLEPSSEAEEGKKSRIKKLLCDVRDKTGHTVLQLAISKRTTLKKAVHRINMCSEIKVPAPINNGEGDLVGSLEIVVAWILLISELTFNHKERNWLLLGWLILALASLIYRKLPTYYSKLSVYFLFLASALSPIRRGKVLIRLALLVLAGLNIYMPTFASWL